MRLFPRGELQADSFLRGGISSSAGVSASFRGGSYFGAKSGAESVMWVREETLSSLLLRSSRFKYIRDLWRRQDPKVPGTPGYSSAFLICCQSLYSERPSKADRPGYLRGVRLPQRGRSDR
jgi:hypothetical protein